MNVPLWEYFVVSFVVSFVVVIAYNLVKDFVRKKRRTTRTQHIKLYVAGDLTQAELDTLYKALKRYVKDAQ